MPRKCSKSHTQAEVGLRLGFRSGLEEKVAEDLLAAGVRFEYEPFKITYSKPASEHTYTPDFIIINNGIIVETKGRFVTADRQKHLLIRRSHSTLDIRFVFSNPNQRIGKRSRTTYAMWCDKHGFDYAKGTIPKEWINE